MTPLILLLASQCVCQPPPGEAGPVVLMSEDQCAARLAPVVRALEGCNGMLDAISTATTAIVALPPIPDPDPEPASPMPRVLGALLGGAVGAGAGVAFASSEGVSPALVGLSSAGGAMLVGALGALIGWVVE